MSMDPEPSSEATYSFDELVERTGLPSRTARSYFEQKLVRGPESRGRYARYGQYHLARLLAIKALKEQQGLSTEEIRQALMRMSDEEVRALASSLAEPTSADSPRSRSLSAFFKEREGEYLGAGPPSDALAAKRPISPSSRQPLARMGMRFEPGRQQQTSAEPSTAAPVGHLLDQLQRLLGRRQPSVRRSTPDLWYRVPITPDIELTVRGSRTAEELQQFELIAAYLREVLLGGLSEPAP